MDELGTVLRAVCLGLCVCGVGVGALVIAFLGVAGGGITTIIRDILGVGQRDEDELIDETMASIQEKRAAVSNKRAKIVGDGGIPDFDAAVAKYAQNDSPGDNSLSAQMLDDDMRRLGSANRFDDTKRGGLRGKRFSRDDDYEIYDDGGGIDDIFGD